MYSLLSKKHDSTTQNFFPSMVLSGHGKLGSFGDFTASAAEKIAGGLGGLLVVQFEILQPPEIIWVFYSFSHLNIEKSQRIGVFVQFWDLQNPQDFSQDAISLRAFDKSPRCAAPCTLAVWGGYQQPWGCLVVKTINTSMMGYNSIKPLYLGTVCVSIGFNSFSL